MQWLLAHQGGWDELLLFGGPIVVAFLAVKGLERRARKRRAEDMPAQSSSEPVDKPH